MLAQHKKNIHRQLQRPFPPKHPWTITKTIFSRPRSHYRQFLIRLGKSITCDNRGDPHLLFFIRVPSVCPCSSVAIPVLSQHGSPHFQERLTMLFMEDWPQTFIPAECRGWGSNQRVWLGNSTAYNFLNTYFDTNPASRTLEMILVLF